MDPRAAERLSCLRMQ